MRPFALRVVVLVATLVSAADARAFCRTTSDRAPAGYDPAVSGCWTNGKPLAWGAGATVPYSLASSASQQVDLADATRVADIAFAAWNDARCTGGSPNVHMYDQGPTPAAVAATDCGLNKCDPMVHDPLHVIVFRDDMWPYNDPVQTLALTTVTYGVDSGTIFDADIEINSCTSCPMPHVLTTQEPPPMDQPNTFDLQAILTHEAGHFFGLAHATDTHSIMYAFYKPGAIQLTADDVAGVCAIYPPAHGGGCSCSSASDRFGPWETVVAAALLVVALARRGHRRRARGDCNHVLRFTTEMRGRDRNSFRRPSAGM